MALHLPTLAELRDTQADLQRFHRRIWVLQGVVLVCLLLLLSSASANQMHASGTVVGNILAEPYLAILASFLLLALTLI